ncbi:kunitz-type serine protease inhibitor homolog dendrotoxin I [Drosophila ficusphila]|uniref:kunitz-type serine protease inhibitor homolog dendrotoxin I n=1 Tax=Drosophila ficusphila TaxID=30025 RepID=UPI0007E76563|nr:kunitz-type serine protease inhibitor homolog dendrotoxin I [Drosophila ficusphila]
MKFILALVCLVLYVSLTCARESCQGRPRLRQNCVDARDEGHFRQRSCRRNANANMWHYDRRSRTCKKMPFHGCGGNRNRFCSLAHCRRKCARG